MLDAVRKDDAKCKIFEGVNSVDRSGNVRGAVHPASLKSVEIIGYSGSIMMYLAIGLGLIL